ncbi:MAG: hypothetical protein HY329_02610 [Chloroflexi bacterium]|nr:hypothetical protein [Chloroflexota bacterium]
MPDSTSSPTVGQERLDVSDTGDDLALLRRYEPVLQFTHGELFFPCAVDEYVRQCSLWQRSGERMPELVLSGGLVDLDAIARYDEVKPGTTLFLRFVQEPLGGREFGKWRSRPERPRFRAPGRLARVGLITRLLDAVFDVSLLLRGRVPGGTVAAAEEQYRSITAVDPRYVYYGRVVREGGYVVLHYVFFYAMNNWRSTFFGVNDHEADWEQIFVYLAGDGGDLRPAWIAYAAHDFAGDDLRRRWDDPELTRVGDHPVVYVGAGSHAGYFQPGEYLVKHEFALLVPLTRAVRIAQRLWRDTFRQGEGRDDWLDDILDFPFIDYARGDGFAIGPGQVAEWSPVLISDDTPWVGLYRGLWGLDTRDPVSGERAPSGPRYHRDGTVRQSWHDPLGWAGLHKVAPPSAACAELDRRLAELERERAELDGEIGRLRAQLPALALEVKALRRSESHGRLAESQSRELARIEREMNALYSRRAEVAERLAACHAYLDDLVAGIPDPPQEHIRKKPQPQTPTEVRQGRLVEGWAALSIGLLLICLVGIFVIQPESWVVGLLALISVFLLVEATLERRLQEFLLFVTMSLALLTAAILVYVFYWQLILVGAVALALLIIIENLRELRHE